MQVSNGFQREDMGKLVMQDRLIVACNLGRILTLEVFRLGKVLSRSRAHIDGMMCLHGAYWR